MIVKVYHQVICSKRELVMSSLFSTIDLRTYKVGNLVQTVVDCGFTCRVDLRIRN